jgi:hypothetical protein
MSAPTSSPSSRRDRVEHDREQNQLRILAIPCLFVSPRPYKALSPPRISLFASKSLKYALSSLLDLGRGFLPPPRVASSPRAFSGRRIALGELANLPSFFRCNCLAPGCTRTRNRMLRRAPGWHPWRPPWSSPPADRVFPLLRPKPSDRDPAPQIRRKRFGVNFAKESLENLHINPRSKACFRKYVFSF